MFDFNWLHEIVFQPQTYVLTFLVTFFVVARRFGAAFAAPTVFAFGTTSLSYGVHI
jgi:hypothetical protein